MTRKAIKAILRNFKGGDLFCGAGGTTAGALKAAKRLKIEMDMLAINHNPTAIGSHQLNHAAVRHLCEELDRIRPKEVVPGGRLHFLAASPECTHHSNAAGGICRNEQSRSTAWHITRWMSDLWIDCGMIENVKEFMGWGPLLPNGRPDPEHKGEYFEAFIQTIRSMGYVVDYRVICFADLGDPTTRERLIILFKKRRSPDDVILWPAPTHFDPERRRPGGLTPKASEGAGAPDFVMHLTHHGKRKIHGTHEPLPTVTGAKRGELALINPEAFMVSTNHGTDPAPRGKTGRRAHSLQRPTPTITGSKSLALVQPDAFVTHVTHSKAKMAARSVDRPLATITTAKGGELALVRPMLNHQGTKSTKRKSFLMGQQSCAALRPDSRPAPTVARAGAIAQIEPMLLRTDMTGANGSCIRKVSRPAFTVDKGGNLGVAEPFIVPPRSFNKGTVDSTRRPLRTIVSASGRNFGLTEPTVQTDPRFVGKYYGTGVCKSVRQPLDTVTTKDRFCLVCPVTGDTVAELDILFRMLQPHELQAAQGFDPDFKFTGTKEEQVKQIGNAVPCHGAEQLSYCIIAQTFGLPQFVPRRTEPWKSARDHVIDWSLQGSSVFNRKRPLSPNTIERIAAGIRKFVAPEWQEPFLVMLYGTGTARSVKRPLPSVTSKGNHIALATVTQVVRAARKGLRSRKPTNL